MAKDVIRMRDSDTRRQQLPEEVAGYVRELILSGEVRPGEFLRMEPIAEAVGVSNTPVREGLLALSNEGFVQLVPRRGFVVSPVSQQDIRDLFWTQAQLAAELAARAAKKITPAQIARLEEIDAEFQKAAEAGSQGALGDLGHRFHREINLAADSRRLTLLLSTVVRHLPNRFYASIESQVAATHSDHPELIEALRSKNSRSARALTEKHILAGADGVIHMLEERGLWSSQESAS
jgi:DNA-binding GntR family transcriptional regulator